MPKLTIDGKPVEVPDGTSVLQAARKAGIRIPTLCYLEGVQAIGACRVCLVEVEGGEDPDGVVRHAGGRGDEGSYQYEARARRTPGGGGAAAVGTRRQLSDLRTEQRLRAAVVAFELGIRQITYEGKAKAAREVDKSTPVPGPRQRQVHQVSPLRGRVQPGAGRGRVVPAVPRVQDRDRTGVRQGPRHGGLCPVRAVCGGVPGGRHQWRTATLNGCGRRWMTRRRPSWCRRRPPCARRSGNASDIPAARW